MIIKTEARKRAIARAKYNPNLIRRRVRFAGVLPGRVNLYASYSMTRPGKAIEHHPSIDLETGAVHCTCEDFGFRRVRFAPTVWSPDEHVCKHLIRAIKNAAGRGELPVRLQGPCSTCGAVDADEYFENCDEQGEVRPGCSICRDCATSRWDARSTPTVPRFDIEPKGGAYALVFKFSMRSVEVDCFKNIQQASYHLDRLQGAGATRLDNELRYCGVAEADIAAILDALGLTLPNFRDPGTRAEIRELAAAF